MVWQKPENDFCIYALICPKTNDIKYIGQTTNGIIRLYGHWRDFKLNKFGRLIKVKAWVKKLKSEGLKFKVRYLDYGTTREELNQKEIYWIKYYRDLNCDLLNHADGGHIATIKKYTDEEKKEISRKTKLAMARPEVREKYLKGRVNRFTPKNYKPWTEENKKNVSNSEYHNSIKLKIIDSNGKIYDSLNDCRKQLNVTKSAVWRTLNGKQKTCKGLILKKYEPITHEVI